MKMSKACAFLVLSFCSLSGVHAAATTGYCNNYGLGSGETYVQQTFGLNVTNFTYNGSNSNNCYGVFNSTASAPGGPLNTLPVWGGGWTYLSKFDLDDAVNESQDPLAGLTFSISYAGLVDGLHKYSLSSTGTSPLVPTAYFDFVGIIKQGNDNSGGGWAAYLFDNVAFDNLNDGGSFFSAFGPGTNGWSNLSFYGRMGDNPGGGNQGNPVPEPGTLALVGLALAGLSVARRQRAA